MSRLPGIIQIDTDNSDWSHVSVLSNGSTNADVQKLKAFVDQSILFLSVEGKEMTSKNQIYIDSDNNMKTGYDVTYWGLSGADYLVENGNVYRYSGSDNSQWVWELV